MWWLSGHFFSLLILCGSVGRVTVNWGHSSLVLFQLLTPGLETILATVNPIGLYMNKNGLPVVWNFFTKRPFLWPAFAALVCFRPPHLSFYCCTDAPLATSWAPKRGTVGTELVCTPLIIDPQQNKSGPNRLAITDNIWRPLRLLCFSVPSVIWTTPLAALASPDSLISLSQSPC